MLLKIDFKFISSRLALILYGMFLFFFVLVYLHPISLKNIIIAPMMNVYSVNDRYDSFVLNVTEFCYPFNDSMELQVNCVVSFVSANFNYDNTNRSQWYKTPTQTITEGGNCRDASILYDSIFKNLGYDTNFVFTNNHVFNMVYNNDKYCTVDQITYWCS